ncbi:hypothetical protein B0T18DRAFT_51313 [Schizothecium vesticola]|uniref:Uncharacterized protein n=1 Tax=Schizothecium vesticola TaxID=314040 RepID=A0AA40KDN4_9PEZI|nr:hypothetical protein B0T18DRAFT_51313 [Schizothecium vesticola]
MTSLDKLEAAASFRFAIDGRCLHPHPPISETLAHWTHIGGVVVQAVHGDGLLPLPTPPRLVSLHSISLRAATRPTWDPPTWIVPPPLPQTQHSLRALHFLPSPSQHLSFHLLPLACLECECRRGWCLFLYIKRQFPPISHLPSSPPLTRRWTGRDAPGGQSLPEDANCASQPAMGCAGTDRTSTML